MKKLMFVTGVAIMQLASSPLTAVRSVLHAVFPEVVNWQSFPAFPPSAG